MNRMNWLLLLLGEELDPIRIQKGMFLFAMESGAPDEECYEFVPYNWGPCSFDIYDDLDSLHKDGLIERRPVPGKSWSRYQASAAGEAAATAIEEEGSPYAKYLDEIKGSIRTASFDNLLKRVYEKYPNYAVNSQWHRV